jgi:AraC-like DNA-binding protein
LTETSIACSEVGFESGFGSVPQFYLRFKQATGMSPSRFRASSRVIFQKGDGPAGGIRGDIQAGGLGCQVLH